MKISSLALNTLRPETVIQIEGLSFVERARAIPGVVDASESLFEVQQLGMEDEIDVQRILDRNLDTEERQIVTEQFIIAGGLAYDQDAPNPLKEFDGEGSIYHRGRRGHGDEEREYLKTFGLNSDGEKDYEHPAVVALLDEMVWEAVRSNRSLHRKLMWLMARHDVTWGVRSAIQQAAHFQGERHDVSNCFARTRIFWQLSEADQERLEPVVDLFEETKEKAWEAAMDRGLLGESFAVPLDIYEHSGIAYSVSGEGMSCRWDSTSNGAVWVPDACALDNIQSTVLESLGLGKIKWSGALGSKSDPLHAQISLDGGDTWQGQFENWKQAVTELGRLAGDKLDKDGFHRAMQKAARDYCRGVVENYNSWVNGDNYGICIYAIDRTTGELRRDLIDHEVWGFIGREYAEDELESEMLLHAIALDQRTH